jgi:hypothetical protein
MEAAEHACLGRGVARSGRVEAVLDVCPALAVLCDQIRKRARLLGARIQRRHVQKARAAGCEEALSMAIS